MRTHRWLILALLLALTLLGTPLRGYAQAPAADAPAASGPVDEFGVPTGDTPPPVPPGYKHSIEAMLAAKAGVLQAIDIQSEIPVPAGVKEILDIEYGKADGKPLLLNLYLPEKLDKPAPGLIFIHGGGWTAGNRKDYKYYTVRFAKRGYVVATISYRFAPEYKFPACVQDAKCAVRWMRANAETYHVDPNRIAALGGSAGGYLSMMLGYTADVPELEGDGGWAGVSSKVQAVVNLYGPCDVDNEQARGNSTVTRFLGQPYDQDPKQYEKASPYRYITPDDAATLIIHGTIDDIVPIAQSDFLAEKLKAAGVPCVYEKYEGWPHTMDIALPVNTRCQYVIGKFLAEHLK